MTERPHRRRDGSSQTGPEEWGEDFRYEVPTRPATPTEEQAPDPTPEIRAARSQAVKETPSDASAEAPVDVFRDANTGPVPVKPGHGSHKARPASSDSAAGYRFGPEPHGASSPARPVRVMTTGVFDLIHLGHIQMLEAAKRLGTHLVVVIARDETVRKQKHDPINDEETRRTIVAALKPVDEAVLGRQGDIYQIVKEIRPDVIALGFDQPFQDQVVKDRCAELGVSVDIVRLPQFDHDLDATRKIVERIGERIQRNQLYKHEGEA